MPPHPTHTHLRSTHTHTLTHTHTRARAGNLMLTPDGKIVILDFGLMTEVRSLTNSNVQSF